ncbi:uncharacterized protein HMPREF1541_07685 [Cyphellophora europaea CBS 101466]|uniref:Peptidase A1 domain-containing protein n=1 Tax=Cyphellophora europaea (strain CBS 101466) TaxID=1220924 RepID=W2RNH0_CYPE1|nr:uncharacterized protein HMPREF1541_07685 [Cyphellophora europaea CBS 101466]ETN38061.1 hypothetical protein HMPREF1541_07685 [Cyphellophora europaea CBS 101466]
MWMEEIAARVAGLLAVLLLTSTQLTVAEDQVPISSLSKPYNVSLKFDDLATDDSGIGWHPTSKTQPALHYSSLYLQGFSVINTSRAQINATDVQCAVSAPNALFAAIDRHSGLPWPRFSTRDTSVPFDPHKPSDRTFKLTEMYLKPAGEFTGVPGQVVVGIYVSMLKSPPDDVPDNGNDAADRFPGLLGGQPAPTLRHGAQLGVGFQTARQKPFRLWPGLFGREVTGFGVGSDILEIQASLLRFNESRGAWDVEDFGFCVDNVVFEVTPVGNDHHEQLHVGNEEQHGCLNNDAGPLLFKANGELALEGDLESEALLHMLDETE